MPETGRILLFSPRGETPRLRYIIQTLLRDCAGLHAEVTTSAEAMQNPNYARIVYGDHAIPGVPSIHAAELLFETGIAAGKPAFATRNGIPVLYPDEADGSLVQFDIFAASFWLISRYEEYQPFTADRHGRFPATASLMHQADLLKVPLVNLWLHHLLDRLKTFYPALKTNLPGYRFLPTFDIDSAWAYRHKPLLRQAGGLASTLFRRDFSSFRMRLSVLLHRVNDPFDTYETIRAVHVNRERPVFFFLVGKRGQFNKNLQPCNRKFRQLICELDRFGAAGLHPSYDAGEDLGMLKSEVNTLADITGKIVHQSRQHFLRMKLPVTYRLLAEAGIQEDYTMGFADRPGFRAGTCTPFCFYDLEREESTFLKIFPLTVMDGTLLDYLHLSPAEASLIIAELHQTVRQHHGMFVSLWHNESLGEHGRWKGWSQVYRNLVGLASSKTDDVYSPIPGGNNCMP